MLSRFGASHGSQSQPWLAPKRLISPHQKLDLWASNHSYVLCAVTTIVVAIPSPDGLRVNIRRPLVVDKNTHQNIFIGPASALRQLLSGWRWLCRRGLSSRSALFQQFFQFDFTNQLSDGFIFK